MPKRNPFLQLKAITLAHLDLILVSAPVAAADQPEYTKAQETSTVINVQDGDTVKLANGMKARYLELDTPETHHTKKPVE